MNIPRPTPILLLAVFTTCACATTGAAPAPASTPEGPRIVGAHQAVFTAPPRRIPSNQSTDAPLLGNGDFLAALGGPPEALQFHLSKADLWEIRPDAGPRGLGRLDLTLPAMKGATYRVTQDLRRATTTGFFEKDGITLTMESAVAATENTLWVTLSATGGTVKGGAVLRGAGRAATDPAPDAVPVIERRYDKGMFRPTGAACALRALSGDAGDFTISPGKPVTLILSASGLANTPDFRAAALKGATEITPKDLADLRLAHTGWWSDFWGKSFIEIPDKALEQRYYLSHYCMASCSRLRHFPPALYGWTLSEGTPKWGGAYFLNYNFYAPFYGLYAANHVEQAMPCNDAITDALDLGRTWCQNELKMDKGILLPVSILPYGVTGAGTTWGQRSNASYCCVPLASTWYATYDLDFAKRAYPFVRATAEFWENFLVLENGRYVDKNDAALENSGRDTNPIVALALIRQVMDLATDMSTALGVDEHKRAKWADIRDRLSDYPTCTVGELPPGCRIALPNTPQTKALPIFRYSEKGRAWQNDNAVGIQHIFPGNGIGLGKHPELLDRARNQVNVMARWIDLNGCNSFYPAAARVGHDPEDLLKHLRHWVDTASPNGMRPDNPHGTEQFSVVPCTLQEMLLQSFDDTLRFFPDWPRDQDARFGTLRARGAFLVSAQLKGGEISGVVITSEKGRDCTVINPWPGKQVRVSRDGKRAETVTGERFVLKTSAGETLELKAQ